MTHGQRETHRKKRVIERAEKTGNVRKACRHFGVARSTFYLWRAEYRELGDDGLANRRCVAHRATAGSSRTSALLNVIFIAAPSPASFS